VVCAASGPLHKSSRHLSIEVPGAGADQKEWRRQVSELLDKVATGQPRQVREMMERYLESVPAKIQRTLRRPDDPTGLTVPSNLALRSAADLAKFLPDRFPRYKKGDCPLPISDLVLDEFLGMGGFGEVWKAVHKDRPHAPPVALKFCTDEAASKSLRREVELLDRVANGGRHENIVKLLYAHLHVDPICLEYEYVGGGDLAEFTRNLHRANKATPRQIAQVILQLAKAVGFAHAQHPPIIHRDLKPANILIQRTERGTAQLKVADFGIGAVASEQGLAQARETGRASGATTAPREYTPLYASPQQRKGKSADPRDDVYAIGVIWYQLLRGDFLTEAPRGEGWKKRLGEQGMEGDLIRLLGRCVEDQAEDRPPNALSLAEELNALLKGCQATSRPAEVNHSSAILADGKVLRISTPIKSSPEPILSLLRKHFKSVKHTYLHPYIPINKLQNVQSKYGRFLQEGEEVLLVHDGTIFGSAKSGFLLTGHGVGWSKKFGEPRYCTYAELNPSGITKRSRSLGCRHIYHQRSRLCRYLGHRNGFPVHGFARVFWEVRKT
jgi:serine/threonine protein kinase